MAINFEAANMAGYNNPPIEVFKAIVDINTMKAIDAPSKTEIIRCLHRGSIPAIMQTATDGSEGNLLWICTWAPDVAGDTVIFNNLSYIIEYASNSESPIISLRGQ